MVGNCEVLRIQLVAPVSTRKVVGCSLVGYIISSSVFRSTWGQTNADPFGESLRLGFFFFLVYL